MSTEQQTIASPEQHEQLPDTEVLSLGLRLIASDAARQIDPLTADGLGHESVLRFTATAADLAVNRSEVLDTPRVRAVLDELQLNPEMAVELGLTAHESEESFLTPRQSVELSAAIFGAVLAGELSDDEHAAVNEALVGLDTALARMRDTVDDEITESPPQTPGQYSQERHTPTTAVGRRWIRRVVGALAIGAASLLTREAREVEIQHRTENPVEIITAPDNQGVESASSVSVRPQVELARATEPQVQTRQATATDTDTESPDGTTPPREPFLFGWDSQSGEEVTAHVQLKRAPEFTIDAEDQAQVKEQLRAFIEQEVGNIDNILAIDVVGSASAEDESRAADAALQDSETSTANKSLARQRAGAMESAIVGVFGQEASELIKSSTARVDSLTDPEMDELAGLRDHYDFNTHLGLIGAYNKHPEQFPEADLSVLDGIIGNQRYSEATFTTKDGKQHTVTFYIGVDQLAARYDIVSFSY